MAVSSRVRGQQQPAAAPVPLDDRVVCAPLVRHIPWHGAAHRGLRPDRRHPDRRARRPRRLDRLVVPAPASTPARASPRCSARPSTAGGRIAPAGGCRHRAPRLPRGHARAGDRAGRRRGHRAAHRLHADPRRAPRGACAWSEGVQGRVPMRSESDHPVRLRPASCRGSAVDGSGSRAIAGPDTWSCTATSRRAARRAGRAPAAWPSSPSPRASRCRSPGLLPAHERAAPAGCDAADRDRGHRAVVARLGRPRAPTRASTARPVVRSLITLKALTYEPTGGIVAAATTSLPETARAACATGTTATAGSATPRFTLVRADAARATTTRPWRGGTGCCGRVAGDPQRLQIMYGAGGERRLNEWELPWLPGYEDSAPVRIGNAASEQFQLDVYGEVMDALHQARAAGHPDPMPQAWDLQLRADGLPGDGLAGPGRRHLGGARAAPALHPFQGDGLGGRRPRRSRRSSSSAWTGRSSGGRRLRQRRSTTRSATRGSTRDGGTFTQYYGSTDLDASLLMIPLVGFLPADDPRVRGTVEAIERELCRRRLRAALRTTRTPARRRPAAGRGRVPALLVLAGRLPALLRAARTRPGRSSSGCWRCATTSGCCPRSTTRDAGRLVGNFPQAFSHVALVNTAFNLAGTHGPAHRRAHGRAT